MFCGRRRVCKSLTSGILLAIVFCVFVSLQFFLSKNHEETVDGGRQNNQRIDSRHILSIKEELEMTKLKPRDRKLVQFIMYYMGEKNNVQNYILDDPTREDYSRGQSKVIDDYLKSKENGFFVDIGASDGESGSVTLFFEKQRHYKGILIEPNPSKVRQLKDKGRRSVIIPYCVRTTIDSKMKSYPRFNSSGGQEDVPCLWMETILLATGRKRFDILSINQRLNELEILKTIPFEEFFFDVITVEFETSTSAAQQASVVNFLSQFHYQAYHQFTHHPLRKIDLVFVKK